MYAVDVIQFAWASYPFQIYYSFPSAMSLFSRSIILPTISFQLTTILDFLQHFLLSFGYFQSSDIQFHYRLMSDFEWVCLLRLIEGLSHSFCNWYNCRYNPKQCIEIAAIDTKLRIDSSKSIRITSTNILSVWNSKCCDSNTNTMISIEIIDWYIVYCPIHWIIAVIFAIFCISFFKQSNKFDIYMSNKSFSVAVVVVFIQKYFMSPDYRV